MFRSLLRSVPGVRRFAQTPFGQSLRYRWALHFEDRYGYTFTQFLRLPTQLAALQGPVLDFVDPTGTKPLRIAVVGCSTGAEPYTVASLLSRTNPSREFSIDACDIDEEVLETARGATYSEDVVRANPLVTEEFIAATFDLAGGRYVVKPEIARHVGFRQADATRSGLAEVVAPADIVFSQNVMCNLRRPAARRLFANLATLLKPRSALFVDGMDIDMRQKLTRRLALAPLPFELQRIHDEARIVRGDRYPRFATGLEPFDGRKADAARRYATIFLRSEA